MSRIKLAITSGSTALVVLIAAVIMAVSSNSEDFSNRDPFKQLYICGEDGKSICNTNSKGPAGGTIFLVDYNNIYDEFNYLEVAPSNWAGKLGVDPKAPWCSNVTDKVELKLNAWSSRRVGIGRSNTTLMQKACTFGAANLVGDYNALPDAKYRDWYLPTIGGLILMYLSLQGRAGFIDGEYWSSSGYSNTGGWVQSMGRGYQGTALKDSLFRVRPMRSF